jgi:hypothetical protein
MLRMISVFVMGLLPDFFAIADSSENGKKNCVRQNPRRAWKTRRKTPNARLIRLSGKENARQKVGFGGRKQASSRFCLQLFGRRAPFVGGLPVAVR